MHEDIEVVWVTRARLDGLERLFARSAGVDSCWCMWPRREPLTHCVDRERNRAAMRALTDSGVRPGLLALIDAEPLGWCALGSLESFPQYAAGEPGAWAIACIYVDATADADRITAALIARAAMHARSAGAGSLIGPPVRWRPGDASVVADITRRFVANGFEKIGAGERMPVLQRRLR